jgi:hypothetical protein
MKAIQATSEIILQLVSMAKELSFTYTVPQEQETEAIEQ